MLALQLKLQEAYAFYERGQLAQAKVIGEELLVSNPNHADVLHLLGIIEYQLNNLQRAIELFDRAVEYDPNRAVFYVNRGNVLLALERFSEAVNSYDQAITTNPDLADAYFNRGNALMALNQIEPAIKSYDAAININSNFAQAYSNRGNALQELDRLSEAVENYNRAIIIKPDYVNAYFNRANAFQKLKQLEKAIENYNRAIDLMPDFAEAYFQRGNVLYALNQFDLSIADYDSTIGLTPDFADAFLNRGLALMELNQFNEAINNFNRAITIKPNFAESYFNRGNALRALKDWKSAVENFNTTIRLKPDYVEAYINRGSALLALGQSQVAIEDFDHALAIDPDNADAYYNKSLVLLATRDFEKGWELYEWRAQLTKVIFHPFPITNEWKGEHTSGSLLVLPEQGMGDEIFFSGMINDLQTTTKNITVCIDPRLIPLYQRSFEGIEFISRNLSPDIQKYDAQIYMGSLGRFFRAGQQAFHQVKSSYLKACPKKTRYLREHFLSEKKLRCGLSWASTNANFGIEKTLKLLDLTPVLNLPDIEFVDLQYGDTHEEQAALLKDSGIKLTHVPEVDNFNDIDALASLIDACDIVLTTSNTTAHLAGALGKSVIIMLPEGKGLLWYWHEGTGVSPWYPSVRLVKQNKIGDWASVVEQVKPMLKNIQGE